MTSTQTVTNLFCNAQQHHPRLRNSFIHLCQQGPSQSNILQHAALTPVHSPSGPLVHCHCMQLGRQQTSAMRHLIPLRYCPWTPHALRCSMRLQSASTRHHHSKQLNACISRQLMQPNNSVYTTACACACTCTCTSTPASKPARNFAPQPLAASWPASFGGTPAAKSTSH